MPSNILTRALSFSHLAGVSAKKAEDDKDDDKKAAQDEDDKKDQDREDGDSKKSKRAEDDKDDDKEAAASDDHDDDEDDKKDGKRAADDDDDEEMRGKSAVAQGRRRERARCAAIMGSKAAAGNIVLACKLAFETAMPRSEAIALLEGTPPAARERPRAEQRRNPSLGAGGESSLDSQQALNQRMDAHMKKALGRK